jgi:hypothetical protein
MSLAVATDGGGFFVPDNAQNLFEYLKYRH